MYNALRGPTTHAILRAVFIGSSFIPSSVRSKIRTKRTRRKFMSQHSKALAILALGVAIAVTGLALTRQVIAVAGEADAERLNRAILMYIAEKNPQAPIKAFQGFPEVLVAESQRSNLDHCLALAQAEVESEFRFDAVGAAGEIGLFQILPSTAALFEARLGQFRRPVLNKANRDLGDLANPIVSTKFAMAYLRDIMSRRV